jgi:hypothetical protein
MKLMMTWLLGVPAWLLTLGLFVFSGEQPAIGMTRAHSAQLVALCRDADQARRASPLSRADGRRDAAESKRC